MAPPFRTISELKPGKSEFGLELRLIRVYQIREFQNVNNVFSLECIFHDREGVRIHANIPRNNVEKYRDKLIEGNVYAMTNFIVGMNIMKYKTTTCAYKIVVFKNTRLFEVFHEFFPKHAYEFKSFTNIAALDNVGDTAAFDVMGIIVSHYKPQIININSKPTKLIDLVLEDLDGNTIGCTLWDTYADHLIEFLNTKPEAPVGVIIQFCKTSLYKGEIKITNSYNASKIITDQLNDQIHDFTVSYLSMGKVRSTTISVLTGSSTRTISDEINDGDVKLRTISELLEDGEAGHCWVYATIISIETIGAWSYLACKICLKKLVPKGNQFFCEKCQTLDISGRLRYKLTVRVVDDTGTTTFLLWDKESISLIGKAASEINACANVDEIPAEIEGIANKKALFNVNVMPDQTKNYTGSFTVARVLRDKDLIKKICGENFDSEEYDAVWKDEPKMQEMVGSSSETNELTPVSKKIGDAIKSGNLTPISKSIEEEIKDGDVVVKTIKELLEDEESGEFWILATIDKITQLGGVSYLACKVCYKELTQEEDKKLMCGKCESFEIAGKLRHKIEVKVHDETATTNFLIWEREGMELIGKSVDKDGGVDLLPLEIDNLENMKVFFKVIVLSDQIKDYKGPLTVLKATNDKEMVDTINSSKIEATKSTLEKGKRVKEDTQQIQEVVVPSTPKKNKLNENTAVDLTDDDSLDNKLIDKLSSTQKKRIKRIVKKEK